jgi:GNAT superfamily N-acetyltransferase
MPYRFSDTAAKSPSPFRGASLTDVPYLFHAILEGSLSGSFGDDHLTGRGHVRLLASLLRQVTFPREARIWMFSHAGEVAGFVRWSTRAEDSVERTTIRLCAVSPGLRGRGVGRAMLQAFVDANQGRDVEAYCTKYARAMQRCLKRLRFVRQPHRPPLEHYVLRRAVQSDAGRDSSTSSVSISGRSGGRRAA